MQHNERGNGLEELRAARRKSRGLLWAAGIFSAFVNLLMLTGPLYMLQIYDRVIGSGSKETLLALSVLVAFLFAMMGFLDYARGRILARVGARFQTDLDRRGFDAVVRKSAVAPDVKTNGGLHDLEAIQRLITSPVLIAAFDIPWTPIFFAAIFVFHPMLGWLAVGGALVLVLITIANQVLSRGSQAKAGMAGQNATAIADQIRTEAEMVQAMGMRDAAFNRWQSARGEALDQQVRATDVGGTFTDLFYLDESTMRCGVAKVPSTPADQSEGVLNGIARTGQDIATLGALVHGTTVGTNALLERRGAKTGLITTRGFRDVLEMRRRDRPSTWGLWGNYVPIVPRDLRLEVNERVLADGSILEAVDLDQVEAAARALLALGAEALCLFSSTPMPIPRTKNKRSNACVRSGQTNTSRPLRKSCPISASSSVVRPPP